MLVDRHNLMTTASFEPATMIVLVAQKILQRAEQKCTEPAFLSYLRDSTYFFQADGQKNSGEDPALREKRDPEVAKRYKEVANTLRRNRKALLLAVSVGSDCPARKIRVQCVAANAAPPSCNVPGSAFIILDRLSLTEYQQIECQ